MTGKMVSLFFCANVFFLAGDGTEEALSDEEIDKLENKKPEKMQQNLKNYIVKGKFAFLFKGLSSINIPTDLESVPLVGVDFCCNNPKMIMATKCDYL